MTGGGVFSRGDGKKQKRLPDLKCRGENGENRDKSLRENKYELIGLRGKIQNVVPGGGVFSRGDGKKQKRLSDLKCRGEKWRKSR